MKRQCKFLKTSQILVHAVADWLWDNRCRAADATGIPSFAHLLAVVPTRQAARRLALALAEKAAALRTGAAGCIPPRFATPPEIAFPPADADGVASEAVSLSLLATLLRDGKLVGSLETLFPPSDGNDRSEPPGFARALGLARQLHDIWDLLSENALTFADVATSRHVGDDAPRWQDLAELERVFFAELACHGLRHRAAAIRDFVNAPPPPAGVEEIVFAALPGAPPAFYTVAQNLAAGAGLALTILIHADENEAALFDELGRPKPWETREPAQGAPPLRDGQIQLAADPAQQAAGAAGLAAGFFNGGVPVALGNADAALFNELDAAFLARGVTLRDPAKTALRATSLGRLAALVSDLCLLENAAPYATLSAFLRAGDVREWLSKNLSPERALSDLDKLQNERLPLTVGDVRSRVKKDSALGTALELLGREPATGAAGTHAARVRALLREIFRGRPLDERIPGARELAAAAAELENCFAALASPVVGKILGDDSAARAALFKTLLDHASFSLEPDGKNTLAVEGWLELAWTGEPALIVTGLNEESVPESIVGHPFLPESLQRKLGLPGNADRLARDRHLLRSMLAPRAPENVRLLLGRVNVRGDVLKPSRLLFLNCDDAALAVRAARLFQDPESPAATPEGALPEGWRLAFPLPGGTAFYTPKQNKETGLPNRFPDISATALKNYIASPLGFFLEKVLKMERASDRVAELDYAAFGHLCHEVLERFAQERAGVGIDADGVRKFLHGQTDALFAEKFGGDLPSVLWLQREEIKKRLGFFAEKQAGWFAEGWEIVAAEKKFTLFFETPRLEIHGKVDRLDRNKNTGAWRIIDFKTWDEKKSEKEALFLSGVAAENTVAALGLPFRPDGKSIWADLQLPLYRLAFERGALATAGGDVSCLHFTLGRTAGKSGLGDYDQADFSDGSAAAMLDAVLSKIRAGIFWPPLGLPDEFAALFPGASEEEVAGGIAQDWLDDQKKRGAVFTGKQEGGQ